MLDNNTWGIEYAMDKQLDETPVVKGTAWADSSDLETVLVKQTEPIS